MKYILLGFGGLFFMGFAAAWFDEWETDRRHRTVKISAANYAKVVEVATEACPTGWDDLTKVNDSYQVVCKDKPRESVTFPAEVQAATRLCPNGGSVEKTSDTVTKVTCFKDG